MRTYEEEVAAGLKVVGLIDARIKSLRGRKETLEQDLDQIAVVRGQRTFDGQIEGVISTITSTFSARITSLQSSGTSGRALIRRSVTRQTRRGIRS